jgi:hypothetical protein
MNIIRQAEKQVVRPKNRGRRISPTLVAIAATTFFGSGNRAIADAPEFGSLRLVCAAQPTAPNYQVQTQTCASYIQGATDALKISQNIFKLSNSKSPINRFCLPDNIESDGIIENIRQYIVSRSSLDGLPAARGIFEALVVLYPCGNSENISQNKTKSRRIKKK